MDKSITINFHLSDVDEWLKVLNKKIPSTLNSDRLILKPEYGSGYIQNRKLQEGLSVSFFDLTINVPTILSRTPISENLCCLMHFHFSNTEIEASINDKSVLFHKQQSNIHFSSSIVPTNYVVPVGRPIKLLHIWMKREWLKNYLDSKSNIYNEIVEDKPIAFYGSFNYKLNIISILNDTTPKGELLAKIYTVINDLFVRYKEVQSNLNNISSQDLNTILSAKSVIEQSIPKRRSIKELAQNSMMSQSKFKKCFKKALGISPYQYHLKLKMDLAKLMLEQGQISVKDVALSLHYSHMSNFSKLFKETHGYLPSDILKT